MLLRSLEHTTFGGVGSKAEYRHNPYHDPATGRFTSGGGGGSFYKPNGSLNSKDKFRMYANGGGLTNSQNSGRIKSTPKERQEFKRAIVGTKTQSDTIIKDIYDHAADRMIQRNISPQTVIDMLTSNSITIFPGNVAARHCVQRDGIRIVYSDAGDIVTAIVANKR